MRNPPYRPVFHHSRTRWLRIARLRNGASLSVDRAAYAAGLTEASDRGPRARRSATAPLHRGVYAVGHRAIPLEGRFLAAVKACGQRAVLSHRAAAVLWGFDEWHRAADRRHSAARLRPSSPGPPYPPLLTARRGRGHAAPQHPGDHAGPHPPRPRGPRDRPGPAPHGPGGPVPSPRQPAHAERCARSAPRAARDHTRAPSLIATGPAPTRTELEDVVLDLILDAGLPHPDVNVPIVIQERRVIPDFRWPAQRLVVEADGSAWHDNKQAREDDAERQALLEAHGERVLRGDVAAGGDPPHAEREADPRGARLAPQPLDRRRDEPAAHRDEGHDAERPVGRALRPVLVPAPVGGRATG